MEGGGWDLVLYLICTDGCVRGVSAFAVVRSAPKGPCGAATLDLPELAVRNEKDALVSN